MAAVLGGIATLVLEELEEGPPVETAAVIKTAKVEPRARAARQVMAMAKQARHLQVVTVELPSGVEELEVLVGRMEVVLVVSVILPTQVAEVAAVVPGIGGAEVDR